MDEEIAIDPKDREIANRDQEELWKIAEVFRRHGRIGGVRQYGSGNVNDTFLVTLEAAERPHFILQRINPRVFSQPRSIMANIRLVTEHMAARLRCRPPVADRPWKIPDILPTREGMDYWIDRAGAYWRALDFIDNAHTFDAVQDTEHAHQVGFALGFFHQLISDIRSDSLADTLLGFHITPLYLARYDSVLAAERPRGSPEVAYCMRFIHERRALAPLLEEAKERGQLPLRPIHGDPKINNVMLDRTTGQAVSLIDLDTVKPGLIHYDIGDCLRSSCNLAGEETEQWETVRFDPDCCQAILRGYCSVAGGSLSPADYDHIHAAIRLIAFELGVRFFTDYLQGDVYFRVSRERHNLQRALVQFKLAESIEAQAREIQAIIEALR